jgi:hypothetical protein
MSCKKTPAYTEEFRRVALVACMRTMIVVLNTMIKIRNHGVAIWLSLVSRHHGNV